MAILFKETIAVYDDSWQPTGNIKIEGWSIKSEMKKLRHELQLEVDGPENHKEVVSSCLEGAAKKGLIAAVGSAFLGIGINATDAAWAAVLQDLKNCLGDNFDISIKDSSHWIEWWT